MLSFRLAYSTCMLSFRLACYAIFSTRLFDLHAIFSPCMLCYLFDSHIRLACYLFDLHAMLSFRLAYGLAARQTLQEWPTSAAFREQRTPRDFGDCVYKERSFPSSIAPYLRTQIQL